MSDTEQLGPPNSPQHEPVPPQRLIRIRRRRRRSRVSDEELGPDPDEYYLRIIGTLVIIFVTGAIFLGIWFYYFFYHAPSN